MYLNAYTELDKTLDDILGLLARFYTSPRRGDEFDGTLGAVEHAYPAGEHSRWWELPLVVDTVVWM